MNAKSTLIALLALTTLGGGVLAWHQYQELVDLRAATLRSGERADLQKKIWDLQKANQELEAQLAAARNGTEPAPDAVAAADRPAADTNGGDRRGPRGNRGQQFAVMRELMQKPEVQALMTTAQKAVADARYAGLFRSLNLTPDQADKLSQLLVDRQNALRDVMQAARDQGVNPRTDPQGFQKLITDAESSVNDSIKSLIGDSGYSQLTNYDQTMPQRNVVNALQQRLSYTSSPLSASQADQLVQILASNSPTPANSAGGTGDNGGWRGRGGPGGFGGFGGGGMMETAGAIGAVAGPGVAQISPQAVAQAGTVLDQTQLSTLQQLQQQQQAAEQLRQLARSTWQQANAAGETAATGQAGTPGGQAGPASTGTASNGGRRRGGG